MVSTTQDNQNEIALHLVPEHPLFLVEILALARSLLSYYSSLMQVNLQRAHYYLTLNVAIKGL